MPIHFDDRRSRPSTLRLLGRTQNRSLRLLASYEGTPRLIRIRRAAQLVPCTRFPGEVT